jgi:hypothetical protein
MQSNTVSSVVIPMTVIKQHLAAHQFEDARAVANSSDDLRAPRWLELIDEAETVYKAAHAPRKWYSWLYLHKLLT